jgi:hypothetical protein
VIAVLLTRTGLRNESRPVLWFAGLFYFNIVFSLSGAGVPIPQPLIVLFQGLAQVCLVLFLHYTFYNNRRSPVAVFMGSTILAVAVGLFLAVTKNSAVISVATTSFLPIMVIGVANWTWNAVAAWNGLREVQRDRLVQDWVKSRYKLMIAYSLLFIIPASLVSFVVVLPKIVVLLTFILALAVLVVQYLVWGMPEMFRKWLNQAYVPSQHAGPDFEKLMSMSEEELMNLGTK